MREKKILMIIAFRDFRDEEYFIPKDIFQSENIEVVTASNQEGIAIGSEGGEVKVDTTIDNLNLDEFEAVVLSGGRGCLKALDNEKLYNLVKVALNQNKIVAAICISPVILAKAGVLKGRKATVWSSELDKSAIKILEKEGAVYQSKPVVVDGKIITAAGPFAANEFGKEIVNLLKKE